jgi:DNA-binding transcriptional LysR family regulator
MNWDDLRYVLAIRRSGNLSRAARILGVDQTTVSRRLKAIEEELGCALFIRRRTGLHPTEATENALLDIETMEASASRFADRLGASIGTTAGQIRIASTPWVFNYLLAPNLSALRQSHPGIELNFIADLRERSLSDREAEIALRFEMKPRGSEVELKLAEIPYSVYAHRDVPIEALPWIGSAVDSGNYAPQAWLERHAGSAGETVPIRSNDAGVLLDAVRHKLGKCLLPEVLGDSEPCLRKSPAQGPVLVRNLRLLVHPTVWTFVRVSAVVEWLQTTLPGYVKSVRT